jgi:hypothetical protein
MNLLEQLFTFEPQVSASPQSDADVVFDLAAAPCNSGKTTRLIADMRRDVKNIFLSPTNTLNLETSNRFKANGFRVYNTRQSNAYDSRTVDFDVADVSCLTYHSFVERFQGCPEDLIGKHLFCDEAHHLLDLEWLEILDFIKSIVHLTQRTLLISATMDWAHKSIVNGEEGYLPMKVNPLEYRTIDFPTGYNGPSAKIPADITVLDMKVSEVVAEINRDMFMLHRLAIVSLKTINYFLKHLKNKRILIICADDAEVILTKKFNLPGLHFYHAIDDRGRIQSIDDVIAEWDINVILHTSALESGNSINTQHIAWFIARLEKDATNISWSNVIQSVNRYRGQGVGLHPYRLVFGASMQLSKDDLVRVVSGEWLEENPWRLLTFKLNVASKLVALRPELFSEIIALVGNLEWYSENYNDPNSSDRDRVNIDDVRDAAWEMMRGAYLFHEQQYFDEKEYVEKFRQYNSIIKVNSYIRYHLSLQIERDSPHVSVEYDMNAGYASIFLVECGRPDLIPDFLATRQQWNLKACTNSLIHRMGYDKAIADPETAAYYRHCGITKADGLIPSLEKFFGVTLSDSLRSLYASTTGLGIFYYFASREQRWVKRFRQHIEQVLGKGEYRSSRQHDGLRLWIRREDLHLMEDEYLIDHIIFRREDYHSGRDKGYAKRPGRDLTTHPGFFVCSTRKGQFVGKAVGKAVGRSLENRANNEILIEQCITFGIMNSLGKCRATAREVWDSADVEVKNKNFNSFYKWYVQNVPG